MFLVPQNAGNGIYTFQILGGGGGGGGGGGMPPDPSSYTRSTYAQAKNLTLIHF